jgi:hypothetical protein
MTIAVSYPGVGIGEDASPSLSIYHSPTAVPAILLDSADALTAVTGSGLRVSSWFDYAQRVKDNLRSMYSTNFDASENGRRDRIVRAYFESGGGYCYLTNVQGGDGVIPQYDDINLIVSASQDSGKSGCTDVGTWCQPGTGRFAIMDSHLDEISYGFKPDWSGNPCAAVHDPYLLANWTQNRVPSRLAWGHHEF